MADHGPFGTEDDARALPAVRAIYEVFRAGKGGLSGVPVITAACEAAGVGLGTFDRRILGWMANWEPATCAVLAGIIMRAWDASSPLAHCRHCGTGIEPCPHVRSAMPVCKGWRHTGYEDQPVGSHYCGGRPVNPSAEPVTRETGEGNGR